jgi:hypothetical protein
MLKSAPSHRKAYRKSPIQQVFWQKPWIGGRCIDAAPRYDTDHTGQIDRVFELAREYDIDIDIHSRW